MNNCELKDFCLWWIQFLIFAMTAVTCFAVLGHQHYSWYSTPWQTIYDTLLLITGLAGGAGVLHLIIQAEII